MEKCQWCGAEIPNGILHTPLFTDDNTYKTCINEIDKTPFLSPEKKKFKIINPSDEAYIEGSFKACCLATLWFGEGRYSLKEVNGDLEMPLMLFGSPDKWFKEHFGKTFTETLHETPQKEIAEALLSVTLARERTSLNDFTSYAHELGNKILAIEKEKKKV